MPYEAGVSTSETDLIQKLLTFLVANGWTQDRSDSWTSGWRIHIHKGDQFIALLSSTDNSIPYSSTYHRNTGHHIGLCGHDSYAAGSAWNAQPGTSYPVLCGDIGGPHTGYHFFLSADHDTLYCAVECTAGIFRFFGFGKLVPYGTTTETLRWVSAENRKNYTTPIDGSICLLGLDYGHTSYLTSQPNTWLRLNIDGSDVWRMISSSAGAPATKCVGSIRAAGFCESFRSSSPSTWNTGLVLNPILVFANRGSSQYSPVGEQKGISYIDLTNFSDKQMITIGAKDWMVLPCYQRGSAESVSGGWALQKEA